MSLQEEYKDLIGRPWTGRRIFGCYNIIRDYYRETRGRELADFNARKVYSFTPEAIEDLADKKIPGFGEIFRVVSLKSVGTSSIQSRACAVLAKGKYIFALPGSSGGVMDAWDKILVHQLNINHKPCNFVELFPRLKEK